MANNIAIVTKLISSGTDINAIIDDENDSTALMLASQRGYSALTQKLLSVPGLMVNSQDKQGNTALILAARNSHTEITKYLLADHRIDVNAKATSGQTALIWAVWSGYINITRMLLESPQIELNAKNMNGETAITMATVDVAKYLLYSGKVLLGGNKELSNHTAAGLKLEDLCRNIANYAHDSTGYILFATMRTMILSLAIAVSNDHAVTLPQRINLLAARIRGSISSFPPLILPFLATIVTPFPTRLNLLVARICGVAFREDLTAQHTGITMPKFIAVSSLMKSAKLTQLVHSFNSYLSIRTLMLRKKVDHMFAHISYELKAIMLSFIVVGDTAILAKELFDAMESDHIAAASSLGSEPAAELDDILVKAVF